jgi:hypothetical protein
MIGYKMSRFEFHLIRLGPSLLYRSNALSAYECAIQNIRIHILNPFVITQRSSLSNKHTISRTKFMPIVVMLHPVFKLKKCISQINPARLSQRFHSRTIGLWTTPSCSSKCFLIQLKRTFAITGGTAFPIIFLTLVSPNIWFGGKP